MNRRYFLTKLSVGAGMLAVQPWRTLGAITTVPPNEEIKQYLGSLIPLAEKQPNVYTIRDRIYYALNQKLYLMRHDRKITWYRVYVFDIEDNVKNGITESDVLHGTILFVLPNEREIQQLSFNYFI